VISFVDRYGSLLEMTKRMLLWRGCQLLGVDDLFSEDSLEVAKQLFYQDFSEINVSRPFDVWWKDQLVSPFAAGPCVWSFSELLPVVEMSGCEFYSSSPQWNSSDHYQWYKNVSGNETRSENILAHWSRVFPYICTGMQPSISGVRETPGEVVDAVGELVAGLSAFSQDYARPIQVMAYPPKLSRYFAGLEDSRLSQFNTEMDNLYQVAVSGDWDDLLSAYQGSRLLRSLWGTPFHYVCFTKSPADISH
jgi:hypothetical protein